MRQQTVRSTFAAAGLAAGAGVLTMAAPLPAVFALLRDLPSSAATLGPEAVALALAGAGCWAAMAWLLLAVVVVGAGARPGRCGRLARGVAVLTVPPGPRRALAVAIGLAVVTSTAGPALAAGPSSQRPAGVQRPAATGVDLDWPVSRPRPITPAAGDPVVVVRPGDTLWAIAARRLPAGAADSAIAAAWPRWYSANRHLIGGDPDRLLPGQRLTPPTPPNPSSGGPS